MALEQAVDQVQVAGPAAAGADRELASEMGLGTGGEGRSLFMADVNPVDALAAAQRIGESVERVADDTVHTFYAGLLQCFSHEIGSCSCHDQVPYRQCGGSEVRIVFAATPKCGLLNQSHTGSISC